jgi:hypothetical protein
MTTRFIFKFEQLNPENGLPEKLHLTLLGEDLQEALDWWVEFRNSQGTSVRLKAIHEDVY